MKEDLAYCDSHWIFWIASSLCASVACSITKLGIFFRTFKQARFEMILVSFSTSFTAFCFHEGKCYDLFDSSACLYFICIMLLLVSSNSTLSLSLSLSVFIPSYTQ